MADEKNPHMDAQENRLKELLDPAKAEYIEANSAEPPEDFMQNARTLILRQIASKSREKHPDVYDALAEA